MRNFIIKYDKLISIFLATITILTILFEVKPIAITMVILFSFYNIYSSILIKNGELL